MNAPQIGAVAGASGALIVGASSGIGAALARQLVRRGYRVALVARRRDLLDQLCAELNASAAAPVASAFPADVHDLDAVPALFARIADDLSAQGAELRVAVYNAGVLPRENEGDGRWDVAVARETLATNVVGGLPWLALAAERFERMGGGVLVGVSSVAGDRGRRNGNAAYMASKAALSAYLEALRYRLAAKGVRVLTIKPGYVATPMTAGMKLPRPLVTSADRVAAQTADAIERRNGVVYAPGYWRGVMGVVRALPAFAMERLPV